MLDLIYILATSVFFALMLVYVRACEKRGEDRTSEQHEGPR